VRYRIEKFGLAKPQQGSGVSATSAV
jgi:hypothetical protein